MLLAGALRLTRARLLDAFGRTLELPGAALDGAVAPVRAMLDASPGALAMPPRLLRPARWLFRLVEASTPVGAEGIEARVDQIDATLQVNPVAGFLLPDHLDESLEVFGIDGAPIGELLHEAVSGGVVWEIAAGREGPADAGPQHGLRQRATRASRLRRRAGGRRQRRARRPDAGGERAEGKRAVGAAAGHRHHAVDGG